MYVGELKDLLGGSWVLKPPISDGRLDSGGLALNHLAPTVLTEEL